MVDKAIGRDSDRRAKLEVMVCIFGVGGKSDYPNLLYSNLRESNPLGFANSNSLEYPV